MKRLIILVGVVTCFSAVSSLAAQVYLSDGGILEAQSVWRADGKVMVMVNRDILTAFDPSEINMKKTFARSQHSKRKKTASVSRQQKAAAAADSSATPAGGATAEKQGGKKTGASLPEKSPENLAPKKGEEGSIRKHKKEMTEKTGE